MVSFIPSLSGTFSFRYFVAPVALLTIALLVLIDQWINKVKTWILILGVVLLGILWAPSFPASQLRSSPAPSWSSEIAREELECERGFSLWVEMTLSPAWPPSRYSRSTLNQPRYYCD